MNNVFQKPASASSEKVRNESMDDQAILENPKYARAVDAFKRLLKQIERDHVSGEAYIRLTLSQGGVRAVKIAVESD